MLVILVMKPLHVSSHQVSSEKSLTTKFALVRSFSGVPLRMYGQRSPVGESRFAKFALERSLFGVRAHMHHQMGLHEEGLPAHLAHELSVPSVKPLVHGQIRFLHQQIAYVALDHVVLFRVPPHVQI